MRKRKITLESLNENGDKIPRMILVGRSHSGKTTLCQYLTNQQLRYHKTQTVQFIDHCILDTPGEYLEQKGFYGALSVTAADAHIIVLVQDATEDGTMFAPSFSMMFGEKPIIGIITKSDAASKEQIQQANEHLVRAGAEKCFITSSIEGIGFDKFLKYVRERMKDRVKE